MDIVHVLAPGDAGGTNTVVRLLAREQQARGHAVRVIAIVDEQAADSHPFVREARDAGIEPTPLALRPRAYGDERRRIASVLRARRPEVVHTHGYRADVIDGAVARELGIPVVTTVHGFTGGSWRNRGYQWLQRRAFRRFDAVVAVSEPLQAELVAGGIESRRVHLVPNAFRPATNPLDRAAARAALGLDPAAVIVGWVGRLSREKGADVLLDAMASASAPPTIQASIVGDGPERRSLERQAAAVGIPSRVHFHGMIPNAERYYAAFDFFVLSSRTEGTPMALFEAMAADVPIVATRVGGVPAMLAEREARLVRADDPAALAAALRECVDQPIAAAERARAARARLDAQHGTGSWIERYEAIYAAVGRTSEAIDNHTSTT
ncbi:MAG TPA: glycosyltransferase [Gemmatimonadaceae bacterium]|nr:glycosyltransferase [Gemmatimonadaceae bacterium]